MTIFGQQTVNVIEELIRFDRMLSFYIFLDSGMGLLYYSNYYFLFVVAEDMIEVDVRETTVLT